MKLLLQKFLVILLIIAILAITPVASYATDLGSPQEEHQLTTGQENIVLRARQVYEIEWTPLRNVIKWSRRGVFEAGVTVRGLPYGMPLEANYVPQKTSFSDFLEAVNDPGSRLYRSIATRTRDAPYYSLDCSAFVTWAWGFDSRLMTAALPGIATHIGRDLQKMEIGDALNLPGVHVLLVTEIGHGDDGEIITVGLMELDPPQAKFNLYGEGGTLPLRDIQRKYLNTGYSIIRFKDRDNVIYLHDCAVPLDNDYCYDCIIDKNGLQLPVYINELDETQHPDSIEIISNLSYELNDYDLSRGMFIVMLSRFAQADISGYTNSGFEDVPINEWYGKAIAWAADTGLIDTGISRFKPREIIPNDEISDILYRFFRWQNSLSSLSAPFIFMQSNKLQVIS